MSFAGAQTFKENLDKVMELKQFKNGDFKIKMDLGYRLWNSKYGTGGFFNRVKPLTKQD